MKISNQDRIRNWNYSLSGDDTVFAASELFFTEQDSGKFGVYRCVTSRPFHFVNEVIFSEPFTILVEGIYTKKKVSVIFKTINISIYIQLVISQRDKKYYD